MSTTVTDASEFLRGPGRYGEATLVVPERALGALASVTQVQRRLDRLATLIEKRGLASGRGVAAPSPRRVGMHAPRIVGEAHEGGSAAAHPAGSGGIVEHLLEGGAGMLALKRLRGLVGGLRAASAATVLGRSFRALGWLGAAIEAYGIVKSVSRGEGVSVASGAFLGGTIGATIGGPVGAAAGIAGGVAASAAYNFYRDPAGQMKMYSDGVASVYRRSSELAQWAGGLAGSALTGVEGAASSFGGAVSAKISAGWSSATDLFHSVSATTQHALTSALAELSTTTVRYRDQIESWVERQGHTVGTWLQYLADRARSALMSVDLRMMMTEWLGTMRQWLLNKLGLGPAPSGGAPPSPSPAPSPGGSPQSGGDVPQSGPSPSEAPSGGTSGSGGYSPPPAARPDSRTGRAGAPAGPSMPDSPPVPSQIREGAPATSAPGRAASASGRPAPAATVGSSTMRDMYRQARTNAGTWGEHRIDPTYAPGAMRGACVRGVAGVLSSLTGDRRLMYPSGGNADSYSRGNTFLQSSGKFDHPVAVPRGYMGDPSQWRIGDVVSATGGHASGNGHIQVFDGKNWVSDGVQQGLLGGYGEYTLHRMNVAGVGSISPSYIKENDANGSTQAFVQSHLSEIEVRQRDASVSHEPGPDGRNVHGDVLGKDAHPTVGYWRGDWKKDGAAPADSSDPSWKAVERDAAEGTADIARREAEAVSRGGPPQANTPRDSASSRSAATGNPQDVLSETALRDAYDRRSSVFGSLSAPSISGGDPDVAFSLRGEGMRRSISGGAPSVVPSQDSVPQATTVEEASPASPAPSAADSADAALPNETSRTHRRRGIDDVPTVHPDPSLTIHTHGDDH